MGCNDRAGRFDPDHHLIENTKCIAREFLLRTDFRQMLLATYGIRRPWDKPLSISSREIVSLEGTATVEVIVLNRAIFLTKTDYLAGLWIFEPVHPKTDGCSATYGHVGANR